MLHSIHIEGFKSLKDVDLELSRRLTVIRGANGTGKTSIYKSLELIRKISQGKLASYVASEGGVKSLIWSGKRKRRKSTIKLTLKSGFANYDIEIGYPTPSNSWFDYDPNIKAESIWIGENKKPSNILLSRKGPCVSISTGSKKPRVLSEQIHSSESILDVLPGLQDVPELQDLKSAINQWQFYEDLSPDRHFQSPGSTVGTYSPVLSGTYENLPSAIRTIYELGAWPEYSELFCQAFPDCSIEILRINDMLEIVVSEPGLGRQLRFRELSSGTKRFITLLTALFAPRPSPLMVFNEPEAGLQDDLMPALCKAIDFATASTQIVIVTHSELLTNKLLSYGSDTLHLRKDGAETVVQKYFA